MNFHNFTLAVTILCAIRSLGMVWFGVHIGWMIPFLSAKLRFPENSCAYHAFCNRCAVDVLQWTTMCSMKVGHPWNSVTRSKSFLFSLWLAFQDPPLTWLHSWSWSWFLRTAGTLHVRDVTRVAHPLITVATVESRLSCVQNSRRGVREK